MEYDIDLYNKIKTDENAKLDVLRGMTTETYARWYLQEQGYKVVKILRLGANVRDDKKGSYLWINQVFIERAILPKFNGDKERVIQLLKENIKDLPDFICYKDGEVSFAEIKSNTSVLRDTQEKRFMEIRKAGFKIMVINVNIHLAISGINIVDFDDNCR